MTSDFIQVDRPEKDHDWLLRELPSLQKEWDEWEKIKKLYLYQQELKKRGLDYKMILLAGSLFLVLTFYLSDSAHLLGVWKNPMEFRQQIVNEYVIKLRTLPCFDQGMKNVMLRVPALYTGEDVMHHQSIQYGEAGIYLGQEIIKIYRSNFWFYGSPKKSMLIETLIHEFLHRAKPYWGHQPVFYEKLNKMLYCALKHW
ncbi:MAG: hypothetical protein HQM11_05430 [SAR324 cluster bacterium]|nr:hypothetical protein [SAR324 cluster bacterium]